MRRSLVVLIVALVAVAANAASPETVAQQELLWAALKKGGHAVLIRHATAPGMGDPTGFRLDDCSTQRNLSDAGRDQARRIGKQFHDHRLTRLTVYSSAWCRCLETARLLDLGPVQADAALNSFFDSPGDDRQASRQVIALLKQHASGESIVLVTHQVNITALTGVYPQSGEMVVVRIDGDRLITIGNIR